MDWWKQRLVDASALVALLGLAFVVGGVVLWYLEVAPAAESVHAVLYTLVTHVLFGAIVLVLGIDIERSELNPEERFSVLAWCYGGFTLMVALSVWGHLGSILDGTLTVAFASDFVMFASLGGAFGVVTGINWGRATRNRHLAEQNKDHRDTLALLTRLVSHDIRNDMAIIYGYTDILTEQVDEEGRHFVEVIQSRIDDTVRLLEDTSTLVKSIDEERTFEPIDLSTILEQEVATIRENHPRVTVDAEIPPDLTVNADSLLQQLFSNLLQNAVFHNGPEDLVIDVTAQQIDHTSEVVISDNGTGVPPELRERCFELGEQGEGSEGDGIGLYLVSRLADIYGGAVTLEESSTGGARFRVSLPTASHDESDGPLADRAVPA